MKKLKQNQLLTINAGKGGNYTLIGQPKGDIRKCIFSLFQNC
ncbi:EntF family bacteriocin induction factor [Mammaliicoccus sciuri]|nr:EntF family bacteriocin induction factor [Mammaliicoccus sciuri]UXU84302.1 EntF family bacteriocin induction factor [Mammaliicoccus sciuri]UXU94151.1 EntF family bacteriocin induction factor [Mammaliicoccus sciuri]UXV16099.1 EntF family bacteriocin induction factor [Mammaliicoccus sciuri]UXV24361.1 EntF family bacteriocin induction factor [Mammaliicoccus sciuri]UXV27144.1 EntF family bacteriocin induction factor [Mammaliicoccus sciuri]